MTAQTHFDPPAAIASFGALLRWRGATHPETTAYSVLDADQRIVASITYGDLDRTAVALATRLAAAAEPGARALLLYPPGLDFVVALYACFLAGVVAVPSPLPDGGRLGRTLPRLRGILDDATPALCLTTSSHRTTLVALAERLPRLATATTIATDQPVDPIDGRLVETATAFIQYSSGSTGAPKGVVVSQSALYRHAPAVRDAWDYRPDSVTLTWLPHYHDLGLIEGVLQPLFGGTQAFIMSPLDLIQRPSRWLKAISRWRVTNSIGPNFAFDLCTRRTTDEEAEGLDLRCWRVAGNGAEPVRKETLERFFERFAPRGLAWSALYPCYGLAEATLVVASGGRQSTGPVFCEIDPAALERHRVVTPSESTARVVVGCGRIVAGTRVAIVNPLSLREAGVDEVGEIWVKSDTLPSGYWNRPDASAATFGALIEDTSEGPFMRTGDTGFLRDGELFITGRLKDLIIVRGQNHYPHDLEWTVDGLVPAHPALRPGGNAAFSVSIEGEERIVFFQEVSASDTLDAPSLFAEIRSAVVDGHGVDLHSIVLIRPGQLPKTSSGKKARFACRLAFESDFSESGDAAIDVVTRWEATGAAFAAPTGPARASDSAFRSEASIADWLAGQVAARTGLEPSRVDRQLPLAQLGYDSLTSVMLTGELSERLGRRLAPTLIWDHPTIDALARYLAGGAPRAERAASTDADMSFDPIAIVGLGCRFPGDAHSPDRFWEVLRTGVDAVTEVPLARWDAEALFHDDPAAPGKSYSRHGAFLPDVEHFDAAFFEIAPREARLLDPQQRVVLEVVHEALEDAGMPVDGLAGTRTGVFVGISGEEYSRIGTRGVEDIEAYTSTGTMPTFAAGRVAYALGLRGPTIAIDTACSSSLVAIHLACQSLWIGECDVAIAGGVNLLLAPERTIAACRLRVLSPDGRCKTFDATANGYVRGEGSGFVVLKRLLAARRDGDRILAVVSGSAMNHDGRSNGLTAPSGAAQAEVIGAALARAGLQPSEIDYVEAHGTGTPLGDSIEVGAIAAVFGGTARERPLVLGAVKTNIGHLEAAAGIAALSKVLLALRHDEIPANLHFTRPNEGLDLDAIPATVPVGALAWPRSERRRRAGISSFGLSGTNVHLVIEEAPPVGHEQESSTPPVVAGVPDDSPNDATPGASSYLLPLSAKTDGALAQLAAVFAEMLARPDGDRLEDIVHTAGARRAHYACRLAVAGRTRAEMARALKAFAQTGRARGVARGRAAFVGRHDLIFVFSGQGSQWLGMGRQLLASEPIFRTKLEECDEALSRYVAWSLIDEIAAPQERSRLAETEVAQAVLFAIQVGLAGLLESWGVRPTAVIGHSVGEVAAAHVAGMLSLDAAARVVSWRGRIMQKATGLGKMVWVGLPAADAARAIAGREADLAVGSINDPTSVVLSGATAAVDEVVRTLSSRGISSRPLKVNYAFHSPQMDPLARELVIALGSMEPSRSTLPMYSTVTGAAIDGETLDAAYWGRNVREPVEFARAVASAFDQGHRTFLEIGPHPVLSVSLAQCLAPKKGEEPQGHVLHTLRRETDECFAMREALGNVYAHGLDVSWKSVLPGGGKCVALPTYPWQRERHWVEATPDGPRRAVVQAPADWFYQVGWPEVPRAGAKSRRGEAGHWVVLADRGGLGEAVAAALSVGGGSCTVIHAPSPETASGAAERAVEVIDGQDPLRGVLYLWGLDAVVGVEASADDAGEITRSAVAPALALIRALGSDAPASARDRPRLWIATRGACVVGGDSSNAPCQAALWGLGRVAALEHPGAWGGLVDLDPRGGSTEIELLLTELLEPDAEDQLAFRDDRRYGARLVAAPPTPHGPPLSLSAEGNYLVTGGLGALGLLVARWLVDKGARHLVLTGRHGLPDRSEWVGAQPSGIRAQIAAVQRLEALGARVTVAAVDVADAQGMTALLASVEPPLRGVVHAAGVGPVRTLRETNDALLEATLRPKVVGGWLLHRLLQDTSLDLFVLFSSGAAVWGGHGQGAYAAANAFLEGLAQQRRARSLPALSVAWGVWAEGHMGDAQYLARLGEIGVLPLSTSLALAAIEQLVRARAVECTVTRMDWARFAPVYAARGRRNLLAALAVKSSRASAPPPATAAGRVWSGLPIDEARKTLHALVRHTVADVLGFRNADSLDLAHGFAEQGLDSLMAVQISTRLQEKLGLPLSATLAFDHPTVDRLAAHLFIDVLRLEERTDLPVARPAPTEEPIAIVGAACRFPGGAEDLAAYWQLLTDRVVAVSDVPASRWRAADWYDADPDAPNRTYVTKGGFLRDDVQAFDPSFFRISPREAVSLDPQQRLLLEVSWEALEHAGQALPALRESSTSVFIGVGPNEYAERLQSLADGSAGGYVGTGNMLSVAAGRLSFFLGLHGPSLAVDTACSSSLVALHLACQSLRRGECERALVGGVNVLLSPNSFVVLSRMRALALDGRCKPFSAGADGYGRAEGCAVVVLKRLRDAERDGDRILGLIRGTAVNHDGASSGLTVPNGPAQQALLREALADAGLAAVDVDFVECHGTGTALGDPIEVQALSAVYGQGRAAQRPLLLGSAKANLGHLEPAAGMVGLIKVLLSLTHEQIPGQPELGDLNSHVPWDALPVAVAREATPWPRQARPRRAGVSAFGLSGTNAHVIVEEAPRTDVPPMGRGRPAELLVLSANSAAALDAQTVRLCEHLALHPEQELGDVAFSLATTRSSMDHRLALVVSSQEEMRTALAMSSQGLTPPGATRGTAATPGKLAFLFAGRGAQRLGMGHGLCNAWPAFRDAFDRCIALFDEVLDRPLRRVIWADADSADAPLLAQTAFAEPALFALEYAMAALWRSWGVAPDHVLGRGVGEIVATCVAGELPLEDAVRGIAARGRSMHALRNDRAMNSISALEAEAADAVASVRFDDRLRALRDAGVITFVEMGPKSTLLERMPDGQGQAKIALVPSLPANRPEPRAVLEALGSWVAAGGAIDWKAVFDESAQRVELPTYAWQRERYWSDPPPRAAASRGAGSRWPLAGVRIPMPGSILHHTVPVGPRHQVFLGDHLVFGKVVVPGAFHVAVVLAIATERWPARAIELSGVEFPRAIVLEVDQEVELHAVLTPEGDGDGYHFELATRPDGKHWTSHACGRVEPTDAVPGATLEPEVLEDRSTRRVDLSAAVFERLSAMQIEWGPLWRWLRDGHVSGRLSVSTLAPPYPHAHDVAPLHPGLVDNGFATMMLGGLDDPMDGTPRVPIGVDRLRWWRAPRGNVRCDAVARPHTDGGADFALVDEDGGTVAEVQGLATRRAKRDSFMPRESGASIGGLYRLEWPEAPGNGDAQPEPGWVVVASPGSEMAARLSARLERCVVTELSGLPATLRHTVLPPGIVCLWETQPDENSAETALRVAVEGLRVVQALRSCASPRLVWVTTATVFVQAGDAVAAATSSAWGLGRTVTQEHPELGCTLVDLEPGPEALDALVRELAASDGETEVAWRAGRRHVARLARAPGIASERSMPLSIQGTVLLSGGLGALGRQVARELAEQGVRHLVLTSRQGASTPGASEAVAELETLGARVTLAAADVADHEAMKAVLDAIPEDLPLRGVVHAAGVLDDGVLADQDPERFSCVLSPKVTGAWNLHELTAGHDLMFFVMFSSLSGLLGAKGQSNYAAANSYLDALASQRRAGGLVGQSLAWGPWSEGGMAARLRAAQQGRLARQGLEALSPAEGIALFGRALSRPEALLGLVSLDLRAVREAFGVAVPPVWRGLVRTSTPHHRTETEPQGEWARRLSTLPPARRADDVRSAVLTDVSSVLSIGDVAAIPVDRPFSDLGLDSLMAVELRTALSQRVGVTLPATLAFDHPTVDALSRWLLDEILDGTEPGTPEASSEVPIEHVASGTHARAHASLGAFEETRILEDGRGARCFMRSAQTGRRGPPLLLLHGVGCNHHYFASLAEHLGRHDLLIPSLPGRCGSDGPPLSTVSEAARWVHDLLTDVNPSPVVVIGHSYGGAIAMELVNLEAALPAEKRYVGGLVLVGTPRLPLDPRVTELFASQGESAATADRALSFLQNSSAPQAPGDILQQAAAAMHLTPMTASASDFAAITDTAGGDDLPGAIELPTLVLIGSEDRLAAPRYARYLARHISQSRLVVLEGVGHHPPLEASEPLAEQILSFLDEFELPLARAEAKRSYVRDLIEKKAAKGG